MIALYIAAASIVAVAVALLVARTPAKLRTADQRGITLQTLIVTAVLVLMAGAAGVVIIAITNNAQDNLEGQNSGIDARCGRWEIFDPTLDAAGRGGGQGGLESTAIGCVRVCYIESVDNTNPAAAAAGARIVAEGGSTDTGGAAVTADNQWRLKFSRSDVTRDGGATSTRRAAITGERAAGTTAVALVGDDYHIEVATNQRYCRVWNDTTDTEEAELRGTPISS